VISAFIFHVVDPDPLTPNDEVNNVFWFPFDALLDSRRYVDHPVEHRPGTHAPGILVGEPGRHVVWGLTYRFLADFMEVLGQPLPQGWHTPSSSVSATARNQREGACDPESPDSKPAQSATGKDG
jgi:hypothetical protein